MNSKKFLAVDLGAESGRVMLGALSTEGLQLEELHRFPNTPVRVPSGLYWDTLRLFHEIEQGLTVAGRERQLRIDGIGVDTWGVDFGLLGPDGALTANPRHYRDSHTDNSLEQAFALIPRERVFAQTGIQFMQINSLFQLFAMKQAGSVALRCASRLLFMPDLFSYWLCGVQRAELTIASTSQFYNPLTGRWAEDLLRDLDLPLAILPDIVPPGTALGPILPAVATLTGLNPSTMVYATGGHDTASAVAAVPAAAGAPEGSWCYISSGTWSLMGLELDAPVVNEQTLKLNYTNEVGAAGKIRLLKNIAGLWVLQECRRAWGLAGQNHTYEELTAMASAATPFRAVIDPDEFLEPGDMPARIANYCRERRQPEPSNPGETCRIILESLACRYREVLHSLEQLSGRSISSIHIVGGGSRNEVLNQFVADATGRTVIAGPYEATAAGNILIQAIGAGAVSGLEQARDVVRRSFPVKRFEANPGQDWDALFERFLELRRTN